MKSYTETDAILEGLRLLQPKAEALVLARKKLIKEKEYAWSVDPEFDKQLDQDYLIWARERAALIERLIREYGEENVQGRR